MNDTNKNEFDDLVRRARGYHVHPLLPGEKAGILWADAELSRLLSLEARLTEEGVASHLRKELAYGKPGDAAIIARAVIEWIKKGK
jgi:hypothetical protein